MHFECLGLETSNPGLNFPRSLARFALASQRSLFRQLSILPRRFFITLNRHLNVVNLPIIPEPNLRQDGQVEEPHEQQSEPEAPPQPHEEALCQRPVQDEGNVPKVPEEPQVRQEAQPLQGAAGEEGKGRQVNLELAHVLIPPPGCDVVLMEK